MEPSLRQAASRLGVESAVHFAGMVDDVRPWISAFDLLVQPSRSEGLALAVLEAMAMGVPVLATDVGGMSEAVEDGVNGKLVTAEESGELAEALSTALSDRSILKELGQAGIERAKGFSLDGSVRELGALYCKLLGWDCSLQSTECDRMRSV
jgi:glycosyltransferase involved in cell wall biosynthesis